MKQALRIGVVGSGGMAGHRLRAFSGLDGCRVTALAARNSATGGPLAREYDVPLHGDWRELVASDEVDAVVVCTSNDSHGAISLAALEAGMPVFTEYPLARHLEEAESVVRAAREKNLVVRVAHGEAVSEEQQWLRRQVASLGPLQLAEFARSTPGRGARPEVLFNLQASGPPMLFFIYHVYPLVDLFGPAAWVQAHAEYTGLEPGSGRYQSFVNTLTAGFRSGGTAVWTWAGGVEVAQPEQRRQLLHAGGSLAEAEEGWILSSRSGSKPVHPPAVETCSLESRFAAEVAGGTVGMGGRSRARTRGAADKPHGGDFGQGGPPRPPLLNRCAPVFRIPAQAGKSSGTRPATATRRETSAIVAFISAPRTGFAVAAELQFILFQQVTSALE